MKITYVLKNRHSDLLEWKTSHSDGTFFSCKPGMKTILLSRDFLSGWDFWLYINSP